MEHLRGKEDEAGKIKEFLLAYVEHSMIPPARNQQ
jgi:hypothetical protein